MIKTQFNIGQSVRHKLLGLPGVVVDVDAEYGLIEPKISELDIHESFFKRPWYHVVLQDEDGNHIHTYLAETQIMERLSSEDDETEKLNDIRRSVLSQFNYMKNRT
ncbi:heat shock protein HspQ [Thorsellia kenyensis]|uniref:Heat shock protein HspQ n=1 Tax=Thorsellia kenyensis TaxID=1549888 RepID=A0ABV6C7J5_9GAMM